MLIILRLTIESIRGGRHLFKTHLSVIKSFTLTLSLSLSSVGIELYFSASNSWVSMQFKKMQDIWINNIKYREVHHLCYIYISSVFMLLAYPGVQSLLVWVSNWRLSPPSWPLVVHWVTLLDDCTFPLSMDFLRMAVWAIGWKSCICASSFRNGDYHWCFPDYWHTVCVYEQLEKFVKQIT